MADLPRQFLASPAAPGAAALPPAGPAGRAPVERINSNATGTRVVAEIAALLSRVSDILGSRARFGTILNGSGLADTPAYGAVILDPNECQEFLTVGMCRDAACARRHTVGFTPAPAKIQTFMSKVTPIIDWITSATPDALLAARNRRQRRGANNRPPRA